MRVVPPHAPMKGPEYPEDGTLALVVHASVNVLYTSFFTFVVEVPPPLMT